MGMAGSPFPCFSVTAWPDFLLPRCMYTDASMLGMRAILAQVQEWEGVHQLLRQPLCYCQARVLGCHLDHRHIPDTTSTLFRVITDRHSLQWLRHMEYAPFRSWRLELEDYIFSIRQSCMDNGQTVCVEI